MDIDKTIQEIYFEAHKSMVRRWIGQDIANWKEYGCLSPDLEAKCKKVTGYSVAEFARKAKEQGNETTSQK